MVRKTYFSLIPMMNIDFLFLTRYGATDDLEWYDPQNAFTRDGYLVILIENVENHGLDYRSAMIQSWNKFCFTGGLVEVSVQLPGNTNILGFWPAIWMMGNLGRAGYGATLDGMVSASLR